MRAISGAWGGAMLATVLCIAYNTSANVSALEGGRSHLQFTAILILAGAGAVVGLVIGAWATAIRVSKRASDSFDA